MCTGDNIDTAVAISLSAGIVTEEELVKKTDEEEDESYVCMIGADFYDEVGGLNKITDKDGKEREVISN